MPQAKVTRVPVFCGKCGRACAAVTGEAIDRGKAMAGLRLVPTATALGQLVSLANLQCATCETLEMRRAGQDAAIYAPPGGAR